MVSIYNIEQISRMTFFFNEFMVKNIVRKFTGHMLGKNEKDESVEIPIDEKRQGANVTL